ncbi:hypothetical protein [Rubritalea tangerina]|uniref:hypothetical protein n=1 Tax=Rubritalea tangerina TaxID=430798 RepID=UPI00360609F9
MTPLLPGSHPHNSTLRPRTQLPLIVHKTNTLVSPSQEVTTQLDPKGSNNGPMGSEIKARQRSLAHAGPLKRNGDL